VLAPVLSYIWGDNALPVLAIQHWLSTDIKHWGSTDSYIVVVLASSIGTSTVIYLG